jgi:hypothetical protein
VQTITLFGVLVTVPGSALAVPSFARQTGYTCSQCHTTPPQLTQEGRDFKLNGYTLKQAPSITAPARDNSAGLDLLTNLPLSGWFATSLTATNSPQPGTQNASVEFPQALSLFLAGAWSTHVGSFLQITYDAQSDHFHMDNTDIRYANHSILFDKDLHYGVTLNNNPTVEDLWNATPAWGFPFVTTDVAPTPAARAVINGALAQDVAGLGVYGLWNNHWYAAATVYRSDHLGSPQPLTGTDAAFNIQGVAPYWRVAWQHPSKNNYFEVGTYGLHMASVPNGVSGTTDEYTDIAADMQYDRTLPGVAPDFVCQMPPCSNVLSVRGTYIHESSTLDATFAANGAAQSSHHLDTVEANAEYHWGNRISIAGGWFSVTGTGDPVLFSPAAVTGSATGSPNSDGYILNLSWWPAMNIDIAAQYTGYVRFNGGTTNYDGAGRNATGNNSIYLLASFLF